MRVVLNGLAALKTKTGVGHHVTELYRALQAEAELTQLELYPGRFARRFFDQTPKPSQSAPSAPNQPKRIRSQLKASCKSVAKAMSQWHFSAYTRMIGFDLYHEPNFVPFRSHLPTIITVHDLSVLKHPQWHPQDRVRYHERYFLNGIKQADHIIVVSQTIRQELIKDLNCQPERVTAIYNGISNVYRPLSHSEVADVRDTYDLPGHFFLCVGTIEPRKNLLTVMQAYVDLPEKLRSACPLVLAGPWGWRSESDYQYYQKIGKSAGIRFLGYVPEQHLPSLYASATALLYPSHYEGFGLPPLEMLASGGVVIASQASAVVEVLDGNGRLVAAEDVGGWRDQMEHVLEEPELYQELRQNGPAHAAKYTWQAAAKETIQVYQQVLKR